MSYLDHAVYHGCSTMGMLRCGDFLSYDWTEVSRQSLLGTGGRNMSFVPRNSANVQSDA